MRIPSNKINDINSYFLTELRDLYDENEIRVFFEFCLEEFCGIKRNDLAAKINSTVSESELLKFNFAVKDLKLKKPIQYILGKADFYGLKFIVNENVLIPRPETEELVDLIIKENKGKKISILDIGTGSGCIAISLKKNLPEAEVSAIDISEEALKLAKQNADLNQLNINFVQADILSNEFILNTSSYDIIVSNPPYVCLSEKENMEKNVLDYEPHIALFVADNDPLIFYKVIAEKAKKGLKTGGGLFFEINASLGPETRQSMEERGFKNVILLKDMSNKNRILRGMSA